MTSKATKSQKSARTKTAKALKRTRPTSHSHVPTPWLKLKQMWEAGHSYEAMAKATDTRYDSKKTDPTKPTRAKVWKARNVGVKIDGKLVRFGKRGKGKEEPKKATAGKAVKKVSGKVKVAKKMAKQSTTVDTSPEQPNVPKSVPEISES